MSKNLHPLFQVDGAAVSGGGYAEAIMASMNPPAPANDGQPPAADPDVETMETGAEKAEGQDVVEPNLEAGKPETKPAFDDETEVDLGEGRQPVKLAELKNGYLRQSDYTKKTQELATQRKELETQQAEIKPIREWLEFSTANPYLWSQINQAIQAWQQTGELPLEEVMADAGYAKWINGYQAELARVTRERDEYKSKFGELEFGSTMDKTISELKAEYGDIITPEYEAELREQAKSDNLKPEMVKKIAKGDLAEKKLEQVTKSSKANKQEAEAKALQKLQETRSALPPQPKSVGQRPAASEPDLSSMSYAEAIKYRLNNPK